MGTKVMIGRGIFALSGPIANSRGPFLGASRPTQGIRAMATIKVT